MIDAMERFGRCLDHVLRHEGGYADHPSDPGGATNMGITRKTLARWRKVSPWWDLAKAEVRALGRQEASEIYRALYWDRCRGESLPAGLDLAVFDYAVNSGPARAIKTLQRLLQVAADGWIGPITLAAISSRAAEGGLGELIGRLCDSRLGFLRALTTFTIFGRGWSRRVAEIRASAQAMAGTSTHSSNPQPEHSMQLLSGYRTYIIAGAMLLTGLAQLLGIDLPALEGQSAGHLIMEALAVIFLRRGLSNDIGKA